VFESLVSRLEKDRKKTGLDRKKDRTGPEKRPDWTGKKTGLDRKKDRTAVLVFAIEKSKTGKRPVFSNRLGPVETGLLYPSNTPSNRVQDHVI
jgi:hypothetical protein